MEDMEIRKNVRERYGQIASENGGKAGSCCGPENKKTSGCCNTGGTTAQAREASKSVGYSEAEMDSVPNGANLGLGCGNPLALASIKEGDTVLDLGSGAGFDCFLAANRVGPGGRIIGVDMTPEMLEKARENARKNNYNNVEFRMGEIENLPVADNTVDLITSNCVINLSVDKPRVFREAYRVLKPGGRIMVSDIVLTKELPEAVRKSVQAYVGCVGGASLESEYLGAIEAAGFKEVRVMDTAKMDSGSLLEDPMVMNLIQEIGVKQARELGSSILSVKVSAIK